MIARFMFFYKPGVTSPVLFLRIPLAQRPRRVIPQSSPGIAFPNYTDISGASPLNHPTDPPHPIPLAPPRPNPSCHALCAGANPLRRRDSAAPPHRGPVQGAHWLRLDFWSFPGPAALHFGLGNDPSPNTAPSPPPVEVAGPLRCKSGYLDPSVSTASACLSF